MCSRIGDLAGSSRRRSEKLRGPQRSRGRGVIFVASGDMDGDGGRHGFPRIMHHDIARPAHTSTSIAPRGSLGARAAGVERRVRAGGRAGGWAESSRHMRGRRTAGATKAGGWADVQM